RCFGRRVKNRSVGSRMCPSAEQTKLLSIMLSPFSRGVGSGPVTEVRTPSASGRIIGARARDVKLANALGVWHFRYRKASLSFKLARREGKRRDETVEATPARLDLGRLG